MILLVTGIERRAECAAALERALSEPVAIAESALQATTLLRTEVYSVAIFDGQLFANEPEEMETALSHLGAAVPVHINLAISSAERAVREVRAAQLRRKFEEASARTAASRSLRADLTGPLTTLLLSCELALETSGLPEPVVARLASVHDAAQKLRTQLELGPSPE